MKLAESASGRSWRLLAKHNRVIAAHTARSDRKGALLQIAAAYEVKASLEDQRAALRRNGAAA